MVSELPKLKPTLVISRQKTGQESVWVIKDPASGRFFRFGPIEGFILERFDGKCTAEELCTATQNSFGAALSLRNLEGFAAKLGRLGLLEQPAAANGPKHHRFGGDPFYLRFRAFNPDRLLEKMVKRWKIFFTSYFVIGSALAALAACGITLVNSHEMFHAFRGMFHLQSLLLAWVTVIVVIVAHEFAHGLTCKYFGGMVQEMGFILIYFQPTFFCNVSDAWLFAEKSKRLWVSFAGAYFEIFLWAVATLVWRVTDPHTALNYMGLVVMATSGIKTLFNLNPLIKLDGYYLLSDYLEIPNLRGKAFGYLRNCWRRIWGAAAQSIAETPARERRVYLIYGLLAAVYSYGLFSLVIVRFGSYLVGRYQAWGLAAFTALLLVSFRQPLRRLARLLTFHASTRQGILAAVKRTVWPLIVVLPMLALLYFCHMELRISGEFVILPEHNAEIRAEVEGIIHQVAVDEGDTVKPGDLVVQLSDRDYQADLQKVMAEIEEKQAKLKLLKAGTRPEELDLAQTAITKAQERLKYGRSQLEMDHALLEQHLQSRREYELTEEMVTVREKELEEAKRKLTVLLAGNRIEEIEATQAEIDRLRAQQRFVEEESRLVSIVSPIAGVVTTPRLKEKIGQDIKKGELIALVQELRTVTAEISIPEKEIADVQLGQKVMLKARGYPRITFCGVVSAIAPMATKAEESTVDRSIRVSTRLDNAGLLLRSEMTGNAKIYCGRQRVFSLVTRRLVRYLRVEFWSWW
jgi:multidrug resistance efflux pump